MTERGKPRAAVIGGGIAGIGSAYFLQKRYDVTIFEKGSYLGGHTCTHVISDGPDAGTGVDTGFIVLNDKTYPLLHRFFAELGVPVRYSNMSFGFHCEKTGLQYSGCGLNGLFAQRRNILRPSYFRFISGIMSFARRASYDLDNTDLSMVSLGSYLSSRGIGKDVRDNYIVPMGAAIWSAPDQAILDFPALTFLGFFRNHGLLSFKDRPRWQTVSGGSHAYVSAFQKTFSGAILLNSAVGKVSRTGEEVSVHLNDGREMPFDIVVIAVHADHVLKILADPFPDEIAAFSPWNYQLNRTVLHTDTSILPPNRRAWASWNYLREVNSGSYGPLSVTYNMNLLQGLKTTRQYCVSLNIQRDLRPGSIIREIEYHHPVYSFEAVKTRKLLPSLNGVNRTFFCGSYFGYGFHEDAFRSAAAVASHLGVGWSDPGS